MDWSQVYQDLKKAGSFAAEVFSRVKKQLTVRKEFAVFGRGDMSWADAKDASGAVNESVLAYRRSYQGKTVLVINNLSSKAQKFALHGDFRLTGKEDLLGQNIQLSPSGEITLDPFGYLWCQV